MKPLDPRLLRYARATRGFLVAAVLIGAISSVAIVAQALLLADVISSGFIDGTPLVDLRPVIIGLAAVVVIRAGLAYATEFFAHRAAAKAKSQLRQAVLAHAVALGPVALGRRQSGELATLVGRGIDALDSYFARYLPQLVLAAIVPLVVGITILTQDLIAAIIVGVTLPLIPVFMALIGIATASRVDKQWRTLGRLSGHFVDVVAGLPTLAVFGRARAQARAIQEIGEDYRLATLRVLRVSFMSALVLELISSLAVALVAVSIGLRLVDGDLDLRTGLAVLILVPEAYLPVRMVGVQFHAAADGVGAAERVFEVLEQPVPVAGGTTPVPDLARTALVFSDVCFDYGDGRPPALTGFTATIRPGRVTALVGPSGSGKSSVIAALLGFVAPASGSIRLVTGGPQPSDSLLGDVDLVAWRAATAWVPQLPHLAGHTVAEAVRLGAPTATDAEVAAALVAAGLRPDDASLPAGADSALGAGGTGLSGGQLRRVAIARALLRDAPLVLLDEPTASLDGEAEDAVIATVAALRERGRTIVLVAHRPALVALADDVIDLTPAVALTPAGSPDGGAADDVDDVDDVDDARDPSVVTT